MPPALTLTICTRPSHAGEAVFAACPSRPSDRCRACTGTRCARQAFGSENARDHCHPISELRRTPPGRSLNFPHMPTRVMTRGSFAAECVTRSASRPGLTGGVRVASGHPHNDGCLRTGILRRGARERGTLKRALDILVQGGAPHAVMGWPLPLLAVGIGVGLAGAPHVGAQSAAPRRKANRVSRATVSRARLLPFPDRHDRDHKPRRQGCDRQVDAGDADPPNPPRSRWQTSRRVNPFRSAEHSRAGALIATTIDLNPGPMAGRGATMQHPGTTEIEGTIAHVYSAAC